MPIICNDNTRPALTNPNSLQKHPPKIKKFWEELWMQEFKSANQMQVEIKTQTAKLDANEFI